jgi:hypothetical protein
MIIYSNAPPCGNASYILLRQDVGADSWVLLRRTDVDFTVYDDADAVIVAEGEDGGDYAAVDYSDLANGTEYWYRHYCRVGGDWAASGDPIAVTPAYSAEPLYGAPDVASFVRERVDLGLQAELAAGRLTHEKGRIPVLFINPRVESVTLPVVTVILETRRPEVRGIGEMVIGPAFDSEGFWEDTEGWRDRSVVQVVVWALNHEDRIRLRDSVQRVLMLNLPIFDSAGYDLIEIQESDQADFEMFGAPVYQSIFVFSCQHDALVRTIIPPISDVEVTADAS